jgi:hypothetical protein
MMIDLSISCTIDRPVAVVSIVKAVCATPQRLYAFPYDMAVESPLKAMASCPQDDGRARRFDVARHAIGHDVS